MWVVEIVYMFQCHFLRFVGGSESSASYTLTELVMKHRHLSYEVYMT